MEKPVFECIWGIEAHETRSAVKALWRRYGALESEAGIEKRSHEIVFAVRNNAGDVMAVTTVRPAQVKFLNDHFFYEFRCFIAPDFRMPGLDSLLAVKTKSFLEQQQDAGSKFKGLLMIIENEAIKQQRTKAVWPASGMVFAGFTAEGHHIRVGYFKGVRV